jgi:membrane protease YdiL (CAAX protease family)
MGPLISTELLQALILGLILTIFFGAIASWAWTLRGLVRQEPLLPETPLVERRKPPWGLGTILLMLAAYIFAGHQAFELYARAIRAEQPKQGAAVPGQVDPKDRAQAPERPDDKEADSLPHGLSPIELMCIQGAINGIFILLLPGLARLTSGARLRDLGLSLRGWRRQAAIGIVAVLFLMPIVYSVQMACVSFLHLPDQEREKFKHPLEKMLRDTFSPGVASVALLSAVVLAPVFEELMFRGFIQSWLVKAFERLAGLFRPSETVRPSAPPSPDVTLQADSFVAHISADPDLVGLPAGPGPDIGYWEAADESPEPVRGDDRPSETTESGDNPFRPRSRLWTGAAIGLTSLIFAALHAAQWPAPIPLFLLALGLGVVYQRTGSLIAPICMHAVFNAFSTLMLFLVALQGPDKEKPAARPVLERVAPLEKGGVGAPHVAPRP